MLAAVPRDLCAQQGPAVNLNQSLQSTAPEKRMGVSETAILKDSEGEFIGYNDLVGELKGRDPKAFGDWDHLGGILKIEAGGHEFRILRTNPSIFIDKVFHAVPKKLRVGRSGLPQVPLETVAEIMRVVDPGSVPETTPAAAGTPATPSSMTPNVPAVPAAALGGGLLKADAEPARLPALEVPKTGKNAPALEWRMLVDDKHRRLPARVTIVCDAELTPLADRLKTLVTEALQASCMVIRSTGRRSGLGLIQQVKDSGPDLVLDLMRAGSQEAGLRGAQAARTVEIWTVHEALWPQGGGADEAAFLNHETHNLALGSVLRTQLSQAYPDYTISFTLSPSYLLRRVNAPGAAILIPDAMTGQERKENDVLARAIAAGLLDYTRGLSQALSGN